MFQVSSLYLVLIPFQQHFYDCLQQAAFSTCWSVIFITKQKGSLDAMEVIETIMIRPGVVAEREESNSVVEPGNHLVSVISDVLGKQNLGQRPCACKLLE